MHPPDANEWPPPAFFKDAHGGKQKGDVGYLRVRIIGFSQQGTPYVEIIRKDRTPEPRTSWWAIAPEWLIDGRSLKGDTGNGV